MPVTSAMACINRDHLILICNAQWPEILEVKSFLLTDGWTDGQTTIVINFYDWDELNHLYEKIAVTIYVYVCMYVCVYVAICCPRAHHAIVHVLSFGTCMCMRIKIVGKDHQ